MPIYPPYTLLITSSPLDTPLALAESPIFTRIELRLARHRVCLVTYMYEPIAPGIARAYSALDRGRDSKTSGLLTHWTDTVHLAHGWRGKT